MPNLLLVDDHSIVRTGLKLLIESFLPHTHIEESADGDSAFDKVKEQDFDLIVMDINMPHTDSAGLIGNILAFKSSQKIIMFSMNSEEIYAKRYLKIGAMGYVRKDAPGEEIKNAILTVLNNKRYISPELSEKFLKDMHKRDDAENPFNKLSPREFEIVQHLIRGESVAEISATLKIHTSTIGTHKARIFEKLNCHNIIELSHLAKFHDIMLND